MPQASATSVILTIAYQAIAWPFLVWFLLILMEVSETQSSLTKNSGEGAWIAI
jgi:hypothetical protein